jgi:hypothetical protein
MHERNALRRAASTASENLAHILLSPGSFFPPGDVSDFVRGPVPVKKSEMDLELFDTEMGSAEYSALADIFKDKKTDRILLENFRAMRPVFALLPPVRLISETKKQFEYYTGGMKVLTPALLRSSSKKMGLDIEQVTAGDMVRRLMSDVDVDCGEHDSCIAACDFVLAALRDKNLINADEITAADEVFDLIARDYAKSEGQKETSSEVSTLYWLMHPKSNARHVLSEEEVESPELADQIARAVSTLYHISDINDEGSIDRCEHRILHTFTAMTTTRYFVMDDEKPPQKTPPRFHKNPIAAWMIEDYGKRSLLGTVCRKLNSVSKKRKWLRSYCSQIEESREDVMAAHESDTKRFCSTNVFSASCHLAKALSADIQGSTKDKFDNLRQGIDALFFINDDSGDFGLSTYEFKALCRMLDIFQELAYMSTLSDDDTRTTSGLPFFHDWYLLKGARYYQFLLKEIASLSRNKLKNKALRKFVEGIRFKKVTRLDTSTKPVSDTAPFPIEELQGLFNRVRGSNNGIGTRLLSSWKRTLSRDCDFTNFDKFDRLALANLMLDGADTAKVLDSSQKYFEKQYCEALLGSESECKVDDHYKTSLCTIPTSFVEAEKTSLNVIELLDAVLHGQPNYRMGVSGPEHKVFFRMIRGTNDNFDEVFPERWLLMAPILRTFSKLDFDKSGALSKLEFSYFGRCQGYLMRRMSLSSKVDMDSLFDQVKQAWKLIELEMPAIKNILPKPENGGTPPDELSLSQFALLFSEYNHDECLVHRCVRGGAEDGSMDKSCLERFKGTTYAHFLPAYCQAIKARGTKKKGGSSDKGLSLSGGSGSSKSESDVKLPDECLKKFDAKVVRPQSDFGRNCSPFKSISFESFLDPGFNEIMQGSRGYKRRIMCSCDRDQGTIGRRAGCVEAKISG